MSLCELCIAYQVLPHFSKSRQLCVHDLFSGEVLFPIGGPCVSNSSRLPTHFLNKHTLGTTAKARYALKLKSRLSHHMNKRRCINVQNEDVQHCSFFIPLVEDGGGIVCFPSGLCENNSSKWAHACLRLLFICYIFASTLNASLPAFSHLLLSLLVSLPLEKKKDWVLRPSLESWVEPQFTGALKKNPTKTGLFACIFLFFLLRHPNYGCVHREDAENQAGLGGKKIPF